MQRFVIIAPTRSGSIMLYSALLAHPNILCDNERNTQFRKHLDTFENLLTWFKEFYTLDVRIKIRRKQIIPSEVESVTEVAKRQIKARGFKLLHEHYYKIDQEGYPVEEILEQLNIKVLLLTRHNMLNQYLSFFFAALTNKWSDEPYPENRIRKTTSRANQFNLKLSNDRVVLPISYSSPLAVQNKVPSWLKSEQEIRNRLEVAKIPLLPITYEQLTQEIQTVSKTICDFLDVPSRLLQTRKKKQSPDNWEQYVENLEELTQWFVDNNLKERMM